MKNNCQVCGKPFVGRSDKKYCSQHCKNELNNRLRSSQAGLIGTVDAILHRNHHILSVLMNVDAKKAEFPKIVLIRAGFDFTHYTGTYLNRQGKWYHYIYDFAWMEFSSQTVMVVRKANVVV